MSKNLPVVLSKLCSTCPPGTIKPVEAFHKDSNRPDGRRSSCKECRSLRNAKDYPIVPPMPVPPEDVEERNRTARAHAIKRIVEKHFPEYNRRYAYWCEALGLKESWVPVNSPTGESSGQEALAQARLSAIRDVISEHYREFVDAYSIEKEKLDLQHRWYAADLG